MILWTVNSQGLSFLPHVTGWAGFVASAVDSVEPSVIQNSDVTKAIKIHKFGQTKHNQRLTQPPFPIKGQICFDNVIGKIYIFYLRWLQILLLLSYSSAPPQTFRASFHTQTVQDLKLFKQMRWHGVKNSLIYENKLMPTFMQNCCLFLQDG